MVATSFIPKGTITWVQEELDIVIPRGKSENFNPVTKALFEKYSFRNSEGNYILCWDIAKYMNHSFNSNCLSSAYNFEMAIRDIQEGEELTDDYGYLNVEEPFEPENEESDRNVVNPDDILHFYKGWDKSLKPLFPIIRELDQPLISILSQEIQEEVKEVADGRKKMLSTINLYYKPENQNN